VREGADDEGFVRLNRRLDDGVSAALPPVAAEVVMEKTALDPLTPSRAANATSSFSCTNVAPISLITPAGFANGSPLKYCMEWWVTRKWREFTEEALNFELNFFNSPTR